jgi:hypothetical protein
VVIQAGQVKDKAAALTVKDAVLARSGIYIYSRDEVLARGLHPKQDKPFYREYRPAGVLLKAKDKFNLVPVPREHPAADIDSSNFRELASGVTGGPIEVISRDDGEIELRGKVAFFTRDALDYYNSGNVETSAGYTSAVQTVDNPDEAGYDLRLEEIVDVNHLAIVKRGRGGGSVRVLDNESLINQSFGGTKMGKGSILSFLGIGKSKDSTFVLSKVVLDSIAKVGTLDPAGLEKEIKGIVADYIAPLGDSEAKDMLVGAVSDSFKHPVEVLAQKDTVAKVIDKLYGQCRDADAQAAKAILDGVAGTETDEEKKAKEEAAKKKTEEEAAKKKDGGSAPAKDTAALVEEAVAKDTAALVEEAVAKGIAAGLAGVTDSIKELVDKSVKDALGIHQAGSKPIVGSASDTAGGSSGAPSDFDPSFLMGGTFGVR